MCYWATRQNRLNEAIDPTLFNAQAIETYGKLITYEAKDEVAIVKPHTLFKTGSKWRPFKKGAIVYFNSMKGTHHLTLAYVLHERENPDPKAINPV